MRMTSQCGKVVLSGCGGGWVQWCALKGPEDITEDVSLESVQWRPAQLVPFFFCLPTNITAEWGTPEVKGID